MKASLQEANGLLFSASWKLTFRLGGCMGFGVWTWNDRNPSHEPLHGLCGLCGHWSDRGDCLLVSLAAPCFTPPKFSIRE